MQRTPEQLHDLAMMLGDEAVRLRTEGEHTRALVALLSGRMCMAAATGIFTEAAMRCDKRAEPQGARYYPRT